MQSAIDASAEKSAISGVDCSEEVGLFVVLFGSGGEDVHEVGEAVVGPGNGKLIREVALILEGVDLVLAVVHDFVLLVGVDVLGVEDEILFLSNCLPVHAQYTFGEAIA